MANNKTTYTLQIDAEINSLEKKLGSIQNLMQNVMNSADAPKGLEKAFEKIGGLIDKIRTKASAPIDSRSGFTSIGKDIEAVYIALGSLYKMIGSVGEMSEANRISFLPPEAQKEIATIIKSIESYQAAIASATTETAELIEARRELAKAETAKSKADADLELKQQSLDRAKQEQKNAQAAIDAINERKAALDELLKKQEEIEKFYSTESADGKKPNRSKKYDGVSMRPQDIKRQIKNQEASMVGDADELEKQSKALKQAKIDVESYERQVGTAQRRWNDANETFNAAARAVETLNTAFESGSIEKKQAAYTVLKAEASKLGITVSDLNDEFSETDANILTQRLIELKQKGLAPVTDAMNRAQAETREMSSVVKKTNEEVKEGTEVWKENSEAASQRDAFENKIKSFLGVAGAAQVMRHALRDAMQTISELDKTMTEMSVVTDLEVGDYWDQLPQYTKRANELGLAINDVYKADTLYYQQGLKTNEVVAISTETMKMARIAGLDTAEATDRMTAALRGFNMELNETSAQKIADVYSELAAITAADVDEISTAMTKTASIASSAGMEFETTAAFLAQIVETTRESAETAGTAMKTVIARFQELKKAPEDIGEVDGEIVDANAIETALRSVGVELRDADGQFRELDDVFLELSKKWNTLDKNTQRYIATIAAGSRQQSRFIAMMSDYGRTQELVTAANNSAGASSRQFEKTMDSLESKIEKLKNTWHEFTMGIMDSDLVKFGVDLLTKFLEIVNSVTSAFDGILGSVSKIGSVFAIFKLGKAIFEKFRPTISSFLMGIVDDYKKAGEDAGSGFAQGVDKGIQKQKNKPVTEGEEGIEDEKPKKVPGSLERIKGGGAKGLIANAGIGIMESIGVGHFTEAAQATQDKKVAQAKLAEAQGILGTNETTQKVKKQNYEEKKKILNDYTVRKNGTISKKGKKKPLSGDEEKKAKEQIAQATKEVEAYEAALKNAEEAGKELENASQTQWSSISSGLEAASGAAAGVGLAFGMVGQAFTDAGFEEVGGVISGIGSAFMILSTVMQVTSSILPLLQVGFGAAGTAGVTSGVASTAAWGVFGLIVMAVMAAILITIAVILLVMKAIENASPEKKLENAQKAAESAAEAADDAAEAYDRLTDSLDKLGEKYKALEELTRGTKEWNDAVREINNSVLELIDDYPELAQFVENKEGVLTLDIESEEVQNVLEEAVARKVTTKNESIMRDLAVSKAQNNVKFGELESIEQIALKRSWKTVNDSIGIGTIGAGVTGPMAPGTLLAGATTGTLAGAVAGLLEASATKSDESLQKAVGGLAEAVQSGTIEATYSDIYKHLNEKLNVAADEAEILASQFSNDIDALINYGKAIDAVEAQQVSVYNSIASSAQSLANTLTMTDKQLQQSSVLVDGDLAGEFYEEKMKELREIDLKNLKDNSEVQAAIQETYGAGAKIDKKGKVTYVKDGENKEVTLTADQIKSMVATQYATREAAAAIEYSDDAISRVASVVGSQVKDSKAGQAAINALYMQNEGGALTQADLKTLQSGQIDYQTIWESLTSNETLAYGNDINNLIDDFTEATDLATKAFEKAGSAVRDFMTADMAEGFGKKLEEVAEMAGGSEAKNRIVKVTDDLLGKIGETVDKEGRTVHIYDDSLTEEARKSIQSRINATDWTSIESLLSLQIDLEQQYGYTAKEASTYVDEIAKQAYATSTLTTTVHAYGDLWKANEKVAQSVKRLTDLQWEYNRALAGQGGAIQELTEKMIEEYKLQAAEHSKGYDAANDNIARIYAQGGLNYGVDLRQAVTLGQDGVNVDQSRLDEFISAGKISQSEVDDWLEKLNEQYENADEHYNGVRESLEGIEELEQQGKDAYYELRDMAKEAIVNHLQKQIDLQQQTLDATRDANATLISKIQEQIDDTRQARANEEAKKNIVDLQSQAAYLAMDTSGASALQSLDIDKQIEEAEQNYQDQLVDQAIQSLQDANAKAEEQRERQIALAQMSLDEYQKSTEFQSLVDQKLDEMLSSTDWENTELGQMMKNSFTEGMSNLEVADWMTEMISQIGQASSWKKTDWGKSTSNIETLLLELAEKEGLKVENLMGEAADKKIKNQITSLVRDDFGTLLERQGIGIKDGKIVGNGKNNTVSTDDERLLNALSDVQRMDSDEASIASLQKTINDKKAKAEAFGETDQANKFTYRSREDFYNDSTFDATTKTFELDGETYSSYSGYLTEIGNQTLTGLDNLTAKDAFEGEAISGEAWRGNENLKLAMKWEEGALFNAKINGVKDTAVHLGTTDIEETERLEYIWKKTGDESKPYVYLYDTDQLFIRQGSGKWWDVRNTSNGEFPRGLRDEAKKMLENGKAIYEKPLPSEYPYLNEYKTGGLADFTGPAWLDGTKSKPEIVLNQRDSANFMVLRDILGEVLDGKKGVLERTSSGDNYFDIEINVEKLENDYDVEQIANKIRRMIYDDATYRNVNAVSI